ncbi:MAG TPA: TlpA disulfide reductase family protein [Pyrinomonadaceae bacterium]|nr:TlpA disulfide reductase family protein [Pyrinomonadaceae bacterium]
MKNIKSILASLGFLVVFTLSVSAQTNLTALDSSKVNVEGQKGKVVVLAIGAIWLPLSKEQVAITNKLAKKYAGSDVAVYFVTTDSANAKSKNYASDAEISTFVTRNKLTVSVLRDSDGAQTVKKFDVDQLPSFVVLDQNGKVAQVFGGIDTDPKNDLSAKISQTIDKLL